MNLGTCRFLALAAALLSGAAHAQLRLPSLGQTLSPVTRSPLVQRVEPLVDNVLAPETTSTPASATSLPILAAG